MTRPLHKWTSAEIAQYARDAGQITPEDTMKMDVKDYGEEPEAKRARLSGVIRLTKTLARDVNRQPGIHAAHAYLTAQANRPMSWVSVLALLMIAALAGVAVAALITL